MAGQARMRCTELVAGFLGCQFCLEAATELDFQPLRPHRVESSFLEDWNG
jgi:hypothetical protein